MITNISIADYPVANTTLVTDKAFVPIGFGLEILLPKQAKNGDSWVITVEQFKTPSPLSSAMLGNHLLVASDKNALSIIQNNIVFAPNTSRNCFEFENHQPVPIPDSKTNLIACFYNHVFLAKGRTLWWSDLDDIWEWHPLPENEADFREIEWESYDISGLIRVNDLLYIHFPNCIYEVKYIGKPSIVHISAKVHGIGCVTKRSLAVHNSIQFFLGSDNFYIWSPETGVAPIGSDIWKKFVLTRGDVEDIWSYVDQKNNEICWVSGDFIWAFNYIERHWSKYSTDGVLDHTTVGWTKPQITITSDLENLSELMPTIEKVYPDGLENLWVTAGAIVREQRWYDLIDECLPQTCPFLETDDITYGDLHFHKRIDLVSFDAKYEFPWEGVRVLVAGRDYVTHSCNWVDCGVWTKQDKAKHLDFRTVQGKVLKFRFVLQDQLVTQADRPNGGLTLGDDGRVMDAGDIWDGTLCFDGSHVSWGRQFRRLDGTVSLSEFSAPYRFNFFELNAWGERVDLPSILVGPDK